MIYNRFASILQLDDMGNSFNGGTVHVSIEWYNTFHVISNIKHEDGRILT